jgi:hypothetical protein
MNRPVFALLFILALADIAPATAGALTGKSGNEDAQAIRTDSVLVDTRSKVARISKSLDCKLFKKSASCASVLLEATSTGGRAVVKIAGRTVYSQSLKQSGTRKFDPIILGVWNSGAYELFNVGIISVKVSGNAGAGAQFGASYGISAKPVTASVRGAAQTWGNAAGKIKVEILKGAASGQAEATVNFFNSTIDADIYATVPDVAKSRATFSLIYWELWLKAKVKALGMTIWSKTFVNEKGPSQVVRLL